MCQTAVTLTAGFHMNTPLTHPTFTFVNSVDVTQGLIFELGHRAWFTVGVAENVTGPKTFDFEALAHLNWRFLGSGAARWKEQPPDFYASAQCHPKSYFFCTKGLLNAGREDTQSSRALLSN